MESKSSAIPAVSAGRERVVLPDQAAARWEVISGAEEQSSPPLAGVDEDVGVGVFVGGSGVLVGVSVGVSVGPGLVGVLVGVRVGVLVGVLVGVFVEVAEVTFTE